MKLVVALAQPPDPEGGASARCFVALLRGLAGHGIDVRAVAARPGHAPARPLPEDLPVEVVDAPLRPASAATRIARVRRPRSELLRTPFGERLREVAAQADALHLEEIDLGWGDEGLRVPSAVHLHFLVGLDRPPASPLRASGRDWLEYGAAERLAGRRHAHLVASSPVVAAELARRHPRAAVHLAPLGLDPALYPPAPLDGPPVAGMIGTASWPPTTGAVRRLTAGVWPRVRRAAPGATLRIAGRGMAGMADELRGPGVEVVGEVPSASAFLRGLSVLLYPTPRGSGLKVKALEALASGVPVVTTPCGAEGLAPGPGLVVADGDDALAAAAAELLTDAGARAERGAAARAAFLAHHAPAPATAPLVELYRRLAG